MSVLKDCNDYPYCPAGIKNWWHWKVKTNIHNLDFNEKNDMDKVSFMKININNVSFNEKPTSVMSVLIKATPEVIFYVKLAVIRFSFHISRHTNCHYLINWYSRECFLYKHHMHVKM